MAKHFPLGPKDQASESNAPKGAKIIESAKKEVVDNLKHKENVVINEENALEKKKSNVEDRAAVLLGEAADLDAQIAKKKALLIELSKAEEQVVAEMKEEKKAPGGKKEKNWDLNPWTWFRRIGTRALSGIVGFSSRVRAKAMHIVARPQQLRSKQLYKDARQKIKRTPENIIKSVTGAFYKPHRIKKPEPDMFVDHGPEFANATDKNPIIRNGKKILWGAGKIAAPVSGGVSLLPKFFANVGRGFSHLRHEFLEGIRDSKFTFNVKKWNLKSWKFSKTKEAFRKAFGWDVKGIPANKTMEMPNEHKKAA